MNEKVEKRNHEHYLDPTPHDAIKNLEGFNEEKARLNQVLRLIFDICALAGYEIEGRIVLIDKKTGKKWR